MRKERLWLKAILLLGVIFAIYHPALSFNFLDHDDLNYIVQNPIVQRGISLSGFCWAFTAGLTEQTPFVDYWQPTTVMSRMLDVQLYGMNASGHHFTNILLHILNSLLIWFIFLKLTKQPAVAYMTALLFAIHPLQVEPVVWITARKDLLSVFFGLLSMVAYLRFVENTKRAQLYLISLLLFLMGILAKPSIGIIFTVFCLIDVWPLGRFDGSIKTTIMRIAEKIPFAAFFIAAMAAPLISLPMSMGYYPKWIMLQIASFHYFRYLGKIVYPANLGIYPSVFTYEFTTWQYLMCLAILLVMCIYFLFQFRRARYEAAFGWFWYVLLIIPFAPVNTPGDRFTYLPMVGVVFLILSYSSKFASRNRLDAILVKIALLIVIVASCVTSYRSTFVWKDTATLFEHALKQDIRNQQVQNDYGVLLLKQGKQDEALRHFSVAKQLRQQRSDKSSQMQGRLFI